MSFKWPPKNTPLADYLGVETQPLSAMPGRMRALIADKVRFEFHVNASDLGIDGYAQTSNTSNARDDKKTEIHPAPRVMLNGNGPLAQSADAANGDRAVHQNRLPASSHHNGDGGLVADSHANGDHGEPLSPGLNVGYQHVANGNGEAPVGNHALIAVNGSSHAEALPNGDNIPTKVLLSEADMDMPYRNLSSAYTVSSTNGAESHSIVKSLFPDDDEPLNEYEPIARSSPIASAPQANGNSSLMPDPQLAERHYHVAKKHVENRTKAKEFIVRFEGMINGLVDFLKAEGFRRVGIAQKCGGYSSVFAIGDEMEASGREDKTIKSGQLLRVSSADEERHYDTPPPMLLKPIKVLKRGGLHIEVFPEISTRVPDKHARRFLNHRIAFLDMMATATGYLFDDFNIYNAGQLKNGLPVVLDGGSVSDHKHELSVLEWLQRKKNGKRFSNSNVNEYRNRWVHAREPTSHYVILPYIDGQVEFKPGRENLLKRIEEIIRGPESLNEPLANLILQTDYDYRRINQTIAAFKQQGLSDDDIVNIYERAAQRAMERFIDDKTNAMSFDQLLHEEAQRFKETKAEDSPSPATSAPSHDIIKVFISPGNVSKQPSQNDVSPDLTTASPQNVTAAPGQTLTSDYVSLLSQETPNASPRNVTAAPGQSVTSDYVSLLSREASNASPSASSNTRPVSLPNDGKLPNIWKKWLRILGLTESEIKSCDIETDKTYQFVRDAKGNFEIPDEVKTNLGEMMLLAKVIDRHIQKLYLTRRELEGDDSFDRQLDKMCKFMASDALNAPEKQELCDAINKVLGNSNVRLIPKDLGNAKKQLIMGILDPKGPMKNASDALKFFMLSVKDELKSEDERKNAQPKDKLYNHPFKTYEHSNSHLYFPGVWDIKDRQELQAYKTLRQNIVEITSKRIAPLYEKAQAEHLKAFGMQEGVINDPPITEESLNRLDRLHAKHHGGGKSRLASIYRNRPDVNAIAMAKAMGETPDPDDSVGDPIQSKKVQMSNGQMERHDISDAAYARYTQRHAKQAPHAPAKPDWLDRVDLNLDKASQREKDESSTPSIRQ